VPVVHTLVEIKFAKFIFSSSFDLANFMDTIWSEKKSVKDLLCLEMVSFVLGNAELFFQKLQRKKSSVTSVFE
jgi:hypothetical protein